MNEAKDKNSDLEYKEAKNNQPEEQENKRIALAGVAQWTECWPATQACALTRNQTSDTLVHRPALNPLNYTSQGPLSSFFLD